MLDFLFEVKNGVNKVLKIQLSFTRNIGNTHYVTHVHMNWEQTKPTGVIFKGFYVTFYSQHMLVEKKGSGRKVVASNTNLFSLKKGKWKVMKSDEEWWKVMKSDAKWWVHHFSSLFIPFHHSSFSCFKKTVLEAITFPQSYEANVFIEYYKLCLQTQ